MLEDMCLFLMKAAWELLIKLERYGLRRSTRDLAIIL
jgi:hypothetical protein